MEEREHNQKSDKKFVLRGRRFRFGGTRGLRRSYLISTASVYAAIYVALIFVFSSISYGQLNFRVANVILGLVPIIGWPAIIGQAIGVFVTGAVSPLGPIDLINVLPAFAFSWAIWKLRKVSVFLGLTLYSIGLGLTVSFAISYSSGGQAPFLFLVPYVTIGIFIMTAVFGYALYRAVDRSGALRRYFGK